MQSIIDNFFNLEVLRTAFPEVLQGFLVTIEVAVCVIVFGIVVGLALALVRFFTGRVLNFLVTVYVDVFRTLPQLVIIIFIFFGLPYVGITLSPFATTAIALGAVLSAFASEIFYASIRALPDGQWDAAKALGIRPMRAMRLVILPQAMRLATPLLTNRAIAITKGTALGIAVSLPEALGAAQSVTSIYANPSPLTLAAAFYLLFFIPLVIMSRWIERRFSLSALRGGR